MIGAELGSCIAAIWAFDRVINGLDFISSLSWFEPSISELKSEASYAALQDPPIQKSNERPDKQKGEYLCATLVFAWESNTHRRKKSQHAATNKSSRYVDSPLGTFLYV